jgi:hypothetical protein
MKRKVLMMVGLLSVLSLGSTVVTEAAELEGSGISDIHRSGCQ